MMNCISTTRLTLRPLGGNDLQDMTVYALDRENIPYMQFFPMDDIEEVQRFLGTVEEEWSKELPSFYEYAVCLQGKNIGNVSVYLEENRTVGELGWLLAKEYWGHGYATEAAKALRDYSFDVLGVTRLYAQCDSRNYASENLMKKLGMELKDVSANRRNRGATEDSIELTYEQYNQEEAQNE